MVPALRERDMALALGFYRDRLGCAVERGGPGGANCSLSFGRARIILDSVPTEYCSPGYNDAILKRIGQASPLWPCS